MKILTPAVLIISCFAISMSSLSGQKSLALSARPYVMFKQNSSTQSPLYQLDHKRIYAHAQQNRVEGFLLQLDFPGQLAWKMHLKPSIVHDKDFHLITNTGERIEVSQQITYQGYLADRPSVKIAMTITEDYLHGRIFDQEVYSFETYRHESAGPLVQFVQEKVQLQRAPQCGSSHIQYQRNATDSPLPKRKYREQNKQVGTPAPVELASIPNGNVLVRIGPTLDWQAFNGRINQNAANFNTDLQTMINNINVHYASFGVSYITTAAYIITSGPNPWTDYPNGNGDSNRQSFSSWAWSSNGFPYDFDVPMLFTGQYFGQISWASINAMCTNYASVQMDYHINTTIPLSHLSNIMSHELGHVWGAYHLNFDGRAYYMNSSIYSGNLQWYSSTYSVINNSVQSANCLSIYSCGNGIDADGDGICADVDCDDNDPQITSTDADGDGICSDQDCDDNDGIPSICVQYCIPEHEQCCLEYIQSVSLNDLNNNSGNALVSQGATGYSDYTNLSTDLERGASYTISIDANDSFSDSKVGVWIDWNEDGIFSPQEQVLNRSGFGPWSASFTVPSGAKLGNTRMRVRLQFGANYTPDPCDYSYYYNGETEDYTINVLENSCGTPGIIDADGDGLCSDIDCDDNNAQVTTTDADGDGVCSDLDCNDNNVSVYPGAPCNDNNAATTNDQYDNTCTCVGTPSGNSQTLSSQISGFNDDVEERESDGLMINYSSDLELVYDGWNSMGKQTVGLRFTNLTIPQGATINAAYLQFSSRGNQSNNADLTITGHAHNNAPVFSSANFDASSRTRTSANVNWLPPAWIKGATGAAQQSPDLSAIVQEIVNRSGWNSGQAMVFLINGRKKRRAASYDYDPSRAPELIITYSTVSCPDADNDGVCDDEDLCPGGDDNLDADSDGIPDACDSYCVPEHIYCCNEYLVDVSLHTLNNSSGAPLASGGATAYSDYSNLSTTLNAGSSYSLDVSPNFSFSSSKAGVWIDWNQDKIFSSNEAVLSTSGSGPWNASVQVPANAKAGPTRMRVRLQYGSSYTPDPCDYSYYYNGETEDYSIIVSSSSAKNTDQEDWTPIKLDQPQRPFLSRLHVYPNPTQGRIWINYQAVQRQEVTLSLYDRLGRKLLQKIQLAEEGDNTYPLTFDALAPGIYFISLRTADRQWMQKVVLTR